MSCIGIIGAMEEEVAALKEKMEQVQVIRKASMEFSQGSLEGKQVVVVRSGIGKVNAAVCTQILIDDFKVDRVINTGIAGSLRKEINIGDIVLSTDVLHHDVDARGFGYQKGQIPRMEVLSFPGDEEMIRLGEQVCRQVNPEIQVFRGRVASGDQFISERKVKEEIIENFQ
ncbi:MAG: 5'-methylthioadenosine/adenosylhomocysteine nucleosidase, partial [Blautia sp.]